MTDVVMSIEGLAKRYIIDHQRAGGEGLRHVIESAVRSPFRKRQEAPKRTKEEFWALQDVSFDIRQGEAVAVVGRNGSGKSTLLKLVSRITAPTRGRIRYKGRVASLLEVGTGFHPELTGRENIFMNAALLGMRRAEIRRKFDEIVAFSEVEKFLDTPVKRYSSGMYVRLAFGVAAHLEPEILLVDEVLAVGDATFQKKCLGKMGDVVQQGRTIMFVSHNMAAVKSLCQRAVLFDGGRVVRDGAVDDVVDAYLATGRVSADDGFVPNDVPRSGTGEARLRRVLIRDQSIASVSQVYLGDTFTVDMEFEVTTAVRDAVVGVGLSSLDGVRFASTYSIDGGGEPWSFAPGRHRVSVDLDVVLLPRRYALDIVITRTDGYEIDYVQQVLDFTAVGVARAGRDNYPWPTVHGYVRPRSAWRQPEPVEAAV